MAKWIAISEQTPPSFVPCLCVVSLSDGLNGVVQEVMRYKHGVWVYGSQQEDYPFPDHLTHWMALPAAPKCPAQVRRSEGPEA